MKALGSAKGKGMEWLFFCVFALSFCVVSAFHEPWLDECQAWQIARCASIKDILFVIPHYEAHPPLWHLILAIPAKLGLPFEVGIKLVAGMITLVSGWILLFLSPFPRFIRVLLPFHYFIFYQYGIVSRPYGLMGLVFLLLAMQFEKKNEKPWVFTALLAVECMLSAYGIVIAGGIAIAWILEICKEKEWKMKQADFWKDKRFLALLLLLALALFLIWDISPKEDTVIAFARIGQKLLGCFAYTLFMALPDSTILNVLNGEGILRYTDLTAGQFLLGCLFGILMLMALILFSSKRKLSFLLIPYSLWAMFSAYVYFAYHHMGIIALFVLFWLWTNWEDSEKGWLLEKLREKISMKEKEQALLCRFGVFLGSMLLILPVIWTVFASVNDLRYPYYFARGAASFLKENHLEEYAILCEWSGCKQKADEEDLLENMNVCVMKTAVALAPYFEENPFYNFNDGRSDQAYITFRVPSVQETQEKLATWKEQGPPEVIVGSVNLELLFGDSAERSEYGVVYKIRPVAFSIWKMLYDNNALLADYIYLRKDLIKQLGLEELPETPLD